jgi:hypothetical protein
MLRLGVAMLVAAAVGLPGRARAEEKIRLAEGTKIRFTLNDTLSTKKNREGDKFSGVVSRSVRVGDRVAIPEGSAVRGTVTHVQRAGRVKGRAELGLRLDEIELPNGTKLDVAASLSELDESEKEKVTEEGQVEGQGSKGRDAATVATAAGVGTAIGAIAGGGKGAAIGAGSGAAVGAGAVLLTRGKDAKVKRGSELVFQLDRALSVPAQ